MDTGQGNRKPVGSVVWGSRVPLLPGMVLCLLAIFAAPLIGQAPGSYDAEGNYYWPNGLGRYPLRKKGIWKVQPLRVHGAGDKSVPRATAADLQAMAATLDRLTAIFRATPEADTLEGYWMRESRTFSYPYRNGQFAEIPLPRIPFRFSTGFFPFALEELLNNGQYSPVWGGETSSVYFEFNLLPGPMGRDVIVKREMPNEFVVQIYLQPRVTGEYKGFPVIEGQDLLITRPDRSPWSPAAYGFALRNAIALFQADRDTAEQRLADLRKKHEETLSPAYEQQMRDHLEKYSGSLRTTNPAKYEGRVQGMLRELQYNRDRAAHQADPQRDNDGNWYWNAVDAHEDAQRRLVSMTAEDEQAPACLIPALGDRAPGRYQIRGTIAKLGENPACEPLVIDNHNYFDHSLPRSKAQLLVVRSIGRCGKIEGAGFIPNWVPQPGKVAHGCARHPFYWEQMDWRAVASLVTD